MKLRTSIYLGGALSLFGVMSIGALQPAPAQQLEELPAAPVEAAGVEAEAMLQGPIHEAFATPVQAEAGTGLVAPEAPPAPVEELPPEVKPEGDDVIWIPGYWTWDPVEQQFLWVSGVWREPPPEMRWLPGYWAEVTDGWQWVSGFWAPIEADRVEYLPPPPDSLERGPTSPAPSETHYWVTGCWIYRDGAYAWRPGYWIPYHEGWVWVPAYYVPTPLGFVFCDGYWDYTLIRRGQLFAPVVFHETVYRRPVIRYTPQVVIDVSHVLMHLFVNPGHRHYYYGNYYDDRYQNVGYYAWSQYYRTPQHYDPIFAYYRTHYHIRGVNYVERLEGWRNYFERHAEYRPPRTFREQVQLAARVGDQENVRYSLLGRTLREVVTNPALETRFERIPEDRRRSYTQSARAIRDLVRERGELEASAASRQGQGGPAVGSERQGRGPIARFELPEAPRWPDRSRRVDLGYRADRDERGADDRVRPGEGKRPADRAVERDAPDRRHDVTPPPRPDVQFGDAAPSRRPGTRDSDAPRFPRPGAREDDQSRRPDTRRDDQRQRPDEGRDNRPEPRDMRTGERSPRPDIRDDRRPGRPDVETENRDIPRKTGERPQDSASPALPDMRPGATPRHDRPGMQPGGEGSPQRPGVLPGQSERSARPDASRGGANRLDRPNRSERSERPSTRVGELGFPQSRPQLRPEPGQPSLRSPADSAQPSRQGQRFPSFPNVGPSEGQRSSPDAGSIRSPQQRPFERDSRGSSQERRYRPSDMFSPGVRNQAVPQPREGGEGRTPQPQFTPSERRGSRFDAPNPTPQARGPQGRSQDAFQSRGRSESRNRNENERRNRDERDRD